MRLKGSRQKRRDVNNKNVTEEGTLKVVFDQFRLYTMDSLAPFEQVELVSCVVVVFTAAVIFTCFY